MFTFERIDCAICLNGFFTDRELVKLRCGHCFHLQCILRWSYYSDLNRLPPISDDRTWFSLFCIMVNRADFIDGLVLDGACPTCRSDIGELDIDATYVMVGPPRSPPGLYNFIKKRCDYRHCQMIPFMSREHQLLCKHDTWVSVDIP